MKTFMASLTYPTFCLFCISKDLSTSIHAFSSCDFMKPPLHPIYSSPSFVISLNEDYFDIDRPAYTGTVSIERLEVTFLDLDY